jgi:hypothetical protein
VIDTPLSEVGIIGTAVGMAMNGLRPVPEIPVPTGDAILEFCSDQQPTIADLVASGTNNNWYNTISSASPLDPSTPLVDGASYFATTVDPPCESIERL